jgi:hypothetical protein
MNTGNIRIPNVRELLVKSLRKGKDFYGKHLKYTIFKKEGRTLDIYSRIL